MSTVRTSVPASHVTLVAFERPERRNAVDAATLEELADTIDALERDTSVRAVILTGSGGSFCAGADVHAMRALDEGATALFIRRGAAVAAKLASLPMPVIAAIDGVALGGGFELALACDIRVASARSRLGFPEVRVGAIPGWGGTQRLPRLLGRSVASDLILSGRLVGATEALALGLVSATVDDDVLDLALRLAADIAAASPAAIRTAKTLLGATASTTLADGLVAEEHAALELARHPDHVEGIEAFLTKRAAHWREEESGDP